MLVYVACSQLEKLKLGLLHIRKTNVIHGDVSGVEFGYQHSQRQTHISEQVLQPMRKRLHMSPPEHTIV